MRTMRPMIVALVFLLLAGLSLGTAQTNPGKEEFRAFAVNPGMGPRGMGSTIVDIAINRWSTDADRQAMIDTLKAKGEMALFDLLQKMPAVGTIRLPNTIGYDLHYAYQVPDENGGRRIYIATDRPIRFFEATLETRSFQYPFTMIEMHLDKNDHGQGKVSVATKISISKNGQLLELENYGPLPVLLNDIKKVK